VATYDPDTGTRQPAGGAHAPGATAVRPGLALLRTWARAVRSPGLAAVSAIGSVYAVVEMVLLLAGTIDRASALAAFLLVFAPPTLVATLPDTTVLWRVTALVVGLHAGPILHSPIEQLSPSAYLDSWVPTPAGDAPDLTKAALPPVDGVLFYDVAVRNLDGAGDLPFADDLARIPEDA
jgi:hypothetical protein